MTGDHEHCFCKVDTGGSPICCKCGKVLRGIVIKDSSNVVFKDCIFVNAVEGGEELDTPE